jgi:hypothetical protein
MQENGKVILQCTKDGMMEIYNNKETLLDK